MNLRAQSGITLVETAVAAAVLAIAAGAAAYSVMMFGRVTAQQGGPSRMAALIIAQQELRIAQNAWKYGSPGIAPSGSETIALAVSASTTARATMTTTISGGGTSAQLTVTVQYTPEPDRNGDTGVVSVTGEVAEKAPLPGSQVNKPGLIPMPSGAP